MGPIQLVHTIILDASPLLTNEPSISTLLARTEKVYTTPQVISEIRDKSARARLEVTVLPFIDVRCPKPTSVKVISDFARRTGDLAVLSSPDVHVLALAYELECEMNHGDWRLRNLPGQKGLNGPPPVKDSGSTPQSSIVQEQDSDLASPESPILVTDLGKSQHEPTRDRKVDEMSTSTAEHEHLGSVTWQMAILDINPVFETTKNVMLSSESTHKGQPSDNTPNFGSEDSDSEGWITPSNIRKQQAKDQSADIGTTNERGPIQVATITNDFAMQNVLLQMNLNLLSPSMLRIRHLKTYILRCHACFEKTKDMAKQFCPRCGQPTLTRVACSTNAKGEFQIHLKKNMQWNTRGDRFSIPKPVSGNSNGKVGTGKGGGKGGWGQGLILTGDQKEYLQAMTGQNRKKERNLMDDDYLPGILTGERTRTGARPKVGAGKNVNSKKR
ncbi:Nin1 binding protein [Lambiella insularis]|nr:Nin1 binding protein [Lambiella insularis]